MPDPDTIWVEVAYALPHKQWLERLKVPHGTSARAAVLQAQFIVDPDDECADLDAEHCPIGIFGKAVPDSRSLTEGDRVEIYRPLVNDPREQRRALAARGESMGKKPR